MLVSGRVLVEVFMGGKASTRISLETFFPNCQVFLGKYLPEIRILDGFLFYFEHQPMIEIMLQTLTVSQCVSGVDWQ